MRANLSNATEAFVAGYERGYRDARIRAASYVAAFVATLFIGYLISTI